MRPRACTDLDLSRTQHVEGVLTLYTNSPYLYLYPVPLSFAYNQEISDVHLVAFVAVFLYMSVGPNCKNLQTK